MIGAIFTGFRLVTGFAKSYRIWLVIAGVASVIGGGFLYVKSAETAKSRVDYLEAELARVESSHSLQNDIIKGLNIRIAENNRRWLEAVQREQWRRALAEQRANEIRQQRDRITAELSESRRQFEEEIQHDPALAEFVAHPVPVAVWERLRRAAGH